MDSSLHWLVAAIIVGGAWLFLSKGQRGRPAANARRLHSTGKFIREVVGESNYQDALRTASGGLELPQDGMLCEALLVPENENRYDANAVKVTISGRTVGYLGKEQARLYRGRLKRAGLPLAVYECPAKIVGGGRKYYGVWLDLPDRLA